MGANPDEYVTLKSCIIFYLLCKLSIIFYYWNIWLLKFSMNIPTNGKWSGLGLSLQGVPENGTCNMYHFYFHWNYNPVTGCPFLMTIQLPFFDDNPVALFGQQSGCPSWLKQVEFWFMFYDCSSMAKSLQHRLEKLITEIWYDLIDSTNTRLTRWFLDLFCKDYYFM